MESLVWLLGALVAVLVAEAFVLHSRSARERSHLRSALEAFNRRVDEVLSRQGSLEEGIRHLRERDGQLQVLVWLSSILKVRIPLPPLGGFAIEPDAAALILRIVRERRPRLVVELGSGVSTLILGYLLEGQGSGRVVSVDHDPWFGGETGRHVRAHALDSVAEVRLASLKEVSHGARTWWWYDPELLSDLRGIDLLVVDGPPGGMQELSRYPALPILLERLAPEALVLLDDAKRDEEKRIVELWTSEFPDFSVEHVDTLKGAALLARR